MVQSGGGGCCDCGDVTAWAAEGTCSSHRGSAEGEEAKDLDLALVIGGLQAKLLTRVVTI